MRYQALTVGGHLLSLVRRCLTLCLMIYEILQSPHRPSDSRWRLIFSLPISTFSALGVSHVMRSINVRYLLIYLLTWHFQAKSAGFSFQKSPMMRFVSFRPQNGRPGGYHRHVLELRFQTDQLQCHFLSRTDRVPAFFSCYLYGTFGCRRWSMPCLLFRSDIRS